MTSEALSNLLREERRFPPADEFAARANADAGLYDEAAADRLAFWARQARELVTWETEWDQVLDWTNPPFAKWFTGAKLNVAYNCVDRHVEAGHGDQVAIHWEGEPGDTRTLTYADVYRSVCKTANALTGLGVRKGDRVAIYMPMIPETAIAMLACARLGAPHSVVFGGFSADALKGRIQDADARVVVTADGGYRRGSASALKPAVDTALRECPDVRSVLVVRRTGQPIDWTDGRDVWWHDLVESQSEHHTPEAHDAEHPLYILYTSGTTAKPKGILHTTGGYLTQVAYTHRNVFDLKPETDIFWCAADIGWVTGHSYIVYGPLTNRATTVMYEGTPDTPHKGRWWEIAAKYGVTILYCAPTAIRTFMKWGDDIPAQHDLSSLRLLGTVGEPINPEAWIWYQQHVGGGRCPIVDTWWQTETGAIMLTPLPGVQATKPGSATRPFFGVDAAVVDEQGREVGPNQGGYLVLRRPWPSMLRGIWGDPERFRATYWSRFPGSYFAGDGARRDADGCFWIMGRVDDVMNVSGHRLSTMEIESALVSHPSVVEAAVVSRPDDLTGEAISAFVTLGPGSAPGEALKEALKEHVAKEIGKLARPADIRFTDSLPKTRSGKIMRRLLRDIAAGRETVQDTTTLEDYTVLARLRAEEE